MRLAAVFVAEHDFIFNEPQTINLGGEFLYHFKTSAKDTVTISRNKNENFIEGFFDKTALPSQLSLISAIVGKNGSGKSSILDIIRGLFIEQRQALPGSKVLALIESDNSEYPQILHSDFKKVELNIQKNNQASTEILIPKEYDLKAVQTIYYSPHYDYKQNINFDDIDRYDLSFDKILELDLEDLENKDTNESGWNYSPTEELIFKNSQRQLSFLSSDHVQKSNILQNIFELPEHGEALLFIRGHKKSDDWNTPHAFRPVLKNIRHKLKTEIENWHSLIQYNSKKEITNQLEINKYFIKRRLLSAYISVLERQMEKHNSFLSEGKIDFQNYSDNTKDSNAYYSLLHFVRHTTIEHGSTKREAFDYSSVKTFFETLYSYIDEIDNEQFVQNEKLKLEPLKISKVLELQRSLLSKLFSYYGTIKSKQEGEYLIPKYDRIDGFINYRPTEKKLSSGENALLNLFSRIYDFIENNLTEPNKTLPSKRHYILLFDEADLAFHPAWKRKYINALVSTIPYFFNNLQSSPSVQIIFTTHDPLTLSDIPQENIVYLNINDDQDVFISDKRARSFGANVHDLLADSFFLEDGFIGQFAMEKITSLIDFLVEVKNLPNDNKKDSWNPQKAQKVINLIDEPLIKERAQNLYNRKFLSQDKESLQKQIEKLQKRLDNLNK